MSGQTNLTQYLYQFSLVTLVIGYELIETLCRGFTFKWDRSWVRTTINIMVADVLTWDIHQVTNSLCRDSNISNVFYKHNTYMCRYIARMYNRSRIVDARPSTIDMLTKRWIYHLNGVNNRLKHVVQVIKKKPNVRDKSDPALRVDSP